MLFYDLKTPSKKPAKTEQFDNVQFAKKYDKKYSSHFFLKEHIIWLILNYPPKYDKFEFEKEWQNRVF